MILRKYLYSVHAFKDRILLEGEETRADDDGDDDEVFALKGIPSSESDEDEEDVHEEVDYDEDQSHPTVHVNKGGKVKAKPPPESDDDDDDDDEQGGEEEESWGRKKSAYYSSNAAEIDSEDEEANELEEQEAKRIQAKARDAMLDDDFGLADVDQGDAEETEECVHPFFDVSCLVIETLPARSLNL